MATESRYIDLDLAGNKLKSVAGLTDANGIPILGGNSPFTNNGTSIGYANPVGIGVNAPTAGRLHLVAGDTYDKGFTIEASTGDRLFCYPVPNVGWQWDTYRQSDARRLPMFVQPDGGNFGVGTKVPTEKLQVKGNIKLESAGNGIIFPDGTKQTTAAVIGSGSGYPATILAPGTTQADFQTAYNGLANGSTLIMSPGNYPWAGDANLSGKTGVRVIGYGATIIRDNGTYTFVTGGGSSLPTKDLILEGFTIHSPFASTASQPAPICHYENAAVDGIEYLNLIVKCPNACANGITAVAWSSSANSGAGAGNLYRNVVMIGCEFYVGRMPYEVHDHSWKLDEIGARVNNILIQGCKVVDSGLIANAANGQRDGQFSLSGIIKNFRFIGNTGINCTKGFIEIVGCSDGVIQGNTAISPATTGYANNGLIVSDNAYFITGKMSVTGNTFNMALGRPAYLYGASQVAMSGNTLIGKMPVDMMLSNSSIQGNIIDVADSYALTFDSKNPTAGQNYGTAGGSFDNIIAGNTLRTNRYTGGSNGALISFGGNGTGQYVTTGNEVGLNHYRNVGGKIRTGVAVQSGTATGNFY